MCKCCKKLSSWISNAVVQDANLACWQRQTQAGLHVAGLVGLPNQESVNPYTPLPLLNGDSSEEKLQDIDYWYCTRTQIPLTGIKLMKASFTPYPSGSEFMTIWEKEEKEGKTDACREVRVAGFTAIQGTRTELVPLVVLSAELLKGPARVKRSGSRREVSGDFSPSISFSMSEPRERRWREIMDGWQERERKGMRVE